VSAPDERLLDVYRALDEMHTWRGWHWWPDVEPFEVVVGAILVQNTSWTNVERALARLGAAEALDPAVMSGLDDGELEELVRPSGQYRQKAKKLRAFLELVRRHGSIGRLLALPPEDLRAELLATWGIGKETADCVLLYAALQPRFIVDAYLIRLYSRLDIGPVESSDYDTWQAFFESTLPIDRDFWAKYRALIVLHCKHLCRKRAPKCGECLLAPGCGFATARAFKPDILEGR
jgi:endonuclease-3 related protein